MRTRINERLKSVSILKKKIKWKEKINADSPIFHLYQIRYQTIGRTALHKVSLSSEESFRSVGSILFDEVLQEGQLRVLFDLVE